MSAGILGWTHTDLSSSLGYCSGRYGVNGTTTFADDVS